MTDLFKKIVTVPWLRKLSSVPIVFLILYFLFKILNDAIWTFFLFLHNDTFDKYILNFDGLFKLFQQLKNDNSIYFSLNELISIVTPALVVVGLAIWGSRYLVKLIKNSNNQILKSIYDECNKERFLVLIVNLLIVIYFVSSLVTSSKKYYIKSVNEYVQFKLWMTEYKRDALNGCTYYPIEDLTFYFDIDTIDFVSHFTSYSRSPVSETLKDVLAVTSATPVIFDKSLCEYPDLDKAKTYSGAEVSELLSSYSANCDKKPIPKSKNNNASGGQLSIKISREGFRNIAYLNYKPVAVVDFKCSTDDSEIQIYRGMKLLSGH